MKRLGFLALSIALSTASATTTFGPVENFDVINDTSATAHGFEIKLYGITKNDITSIFGDPSRFGSMMVERYMQPVVDDTQIDPIKGPYTSVTYQATWDGSNWSAGTPTGTLASPPMDSCWPYGDPNYNTTTYPCDHFGVSTSKPATSVEYNWLVENGIGSLKAISSNVPTPQWNVQPVAPINNVPQPPIVDIVVAAPDKNEITTEFGEPQWAKVTATGYGYNVAPEDLLAGNEAVKLADKNVQKAWQLLQKDYNSSNPLTGAIDFTGVQPDPGAKSIIYNIEFYGYSGAIDPSTGQAKPKTSDTPTQPDPNDLGPWKTNQMVAVNLDGQLPAAPVPPVINSTLSNALLNTSYNQIITAKPENINDILKFNVTNLPAGLSFDKATNSIVGKSLQSGTYTIDIEATDITNVSSAVSKANLNVLGSPDFGLKASTPLNVKRGGSTMGNVTIESLNGFNGSVSLSASGLPANTSASFSQITNGSSILTVKATTKAKIGTYTFNVKGTSGALIHQVPVSLNVQ